MAALGQPLWRGLAFLLTCVRLCQIASFSDYMELEQLRQLVAQREFSAFLGVEENYHFEAKGAQAYDLSTEADRYELAKDVTSFANASGGIVVIGLKTARSQDSESDKVESLELFAKHDLTPAQLLGIIKEYVYPKIAGISVSWIEDKSQAGAGAVVIDVPNQTDDTRPYLIARVVHDSELLKQIVFGYARRKAADSIPLTIETLIKAMKHGSSPLSQRLTSLEEKVSTLLEQRPQSVAQSIADTLTDEASRILAERVEAILAA